MTEANPTTDERASHTPAPWTAEISDLLGMIVYAEPCQSMIAALNATGAEGAAYDADVERQAANARLIAAAPDLLAALCGAVSLIEETDWTAFSLSDRAKLDAARAAIAKATGEHS